MIRSGSRASRFVTAVCGTCLLVILAACSRSADRDDVAGLQQSVVAPAHSRPAKPEPSILLFSGTGSSHNDVAAIEVVLNENHLRYALVNSEQLNQMNQSQLQSYRLLIVPGGNFLDMGNSLTVGATESVRRAVTGGLSYLGICAGGILAGAFPAPYKSFNLTSGVKFGFYSAESSGIRKAAVTITTAQGTALDQYWEDGPELSGWGYPVALYPDGKPAVAEGFAGDGWVIITGIHPEAPESWRRELDFKTPVSESNAYAITLIDAALNRRRLPHY
jgi:glutamine amidotransferase-like uncharacterized protein